MKLQKLLGLIALIFHSLTSWAHSSRPFTLRSSSLWADLATTLRRATLQLSRINCRVRSGKYCSRQTLVSRSPHLSSSKWKRRLRAPRSIKAWQWGSSHALHRFDRWLVCCVELRDASHIPRVKMCPDYYRDDSRSLSKACLHSIVSSAPSIWQTALIFYLWFRGLKWPQPCEKSWFNHRVKAY